MSYILTWAPKGPIDESDRAWTRLLDEAIEGVLPVHTQILSTLTLLSNALQSGQSLPPFLPLPQPYEMIHHLLNTPARRPQDRRGGGGGGDPSRGLQRQDTRRTVDSQAQSQGPEPEPEAWGLLDARNMEQQGYTEFAVLQVCSTLIIAELRGLILTVADLVGTVDFSFRVDRGASDTSIESVQRIGTWASRAAASTAAVGGSSSSGLGGTAKGKND